MIEVDRSVAAEKLFSRRYPFPIFPAVSIRMFNQLSGINAILYARHARACLGPFSEGGRALLSLMWREA